MKKTLSVLLAIVMTICMFTAMTVVASAAETDSQSGIEATLVTDKDIYSSDEDIKVIVNVKNTNTYDVNNVGVKVELPEGLTLKSGDLSISGVDIAAGETYSKEVVAIKEAPEVSTDESSDEFTEESSKESTDESSDEFTEESSKESTDESGNESSEESSKESMDESSNEFTEESSKESTDESSDEFTEESSKESTDESSDEFTEESSKESMDESSAALIDNPNDDPSTGNPGNGNNSNGNENTPQTGDSSNMVLWIVLMMVSAAGIFFTVKFGKKTTKFLSLFLCVVMVCTIVPTGAFAAEGDTDAVNITVDKTITVDGDEYVLKSNINLSNSREVVLSNFNADEIFFICGEESTITFTVDAIGNPDEIELCKNENEPVGLMHDDGLNGDTIANDGTYTYVLTDIVESNSIVSIEFYAKTAEQISEGKVVYYFVPLTQETSVAAKTNYDLVVDSISNTEIKYANDKGYIDDDNVADLIAEIKSQLNNYVEQGIVLLFMEENGGFYIKFTSGLSAIYFPKTESSNRTDSVGSDVSMTVSTYQPCFTDMGGSNYSTPAYTLPDGVNFVLEMLDDVATDIDQSFNNYSFSTSNNFDDANVTLDTIKSLHENQIVLWHGHGYYGPMVKSCLLTGEDFDWNGWWWDTTGYFADCVSNRIINSIVVGYDKVIISSKYIDKYCKNLNNSLVYIAACDSGKTSELADAFLHNGAAAVVANSDTIIREYNVAMLYETLSNMIKINASSGDYYTLQEALNAAKGKYGSNDSDARYGGVGATPQIFGGTNAQNYRLANIQTGTLSGKICKASDRSTAISGATINVYKNNNLYTTQTADTTGNYSINLPAGQYYIEITAEGYIDFHSYATVTEGENTYMETFLMVEGSEDETGVASGRVVNSLTGTDVDGVTLIVRKDWNNMNEDAETVTTVTTGSGGNYSVELPLGNYTVVASKDGYITSSFNIIVQSGTTDNQNGTITPEISGDEFLITLTWGENPRDLDSHVEGTLTNGDPFHVYYEHMSQYDGDIEVCNLDYDDTNSYGPEHITLKVTTNEPYYYYIYKYAGSGTVAASRAKITVHQGNTLIAEYNVPTNLGGDDYWNVFAIKDGQLITKNTITSSADTSYAD